MTGPGTNTYLLGDAASGVAVIDPGPAIDSHLQAIVETAAGPIRWILCTHTHIDHSPGAAPLAARTGATVLGMRARYPERQDATFEPAREPAHGDRLEVAGCVLRVLHTPGHTPGGCCLYVEAEGKVITGDTLFAEGVGRTDFPGSSHEALMTSIRTRLMTLPDAVVAYPGHGPATTIGHERRYNPYI